MHRPAHLPTRLQLASRRIQAESGVARSDVSLLNFVVSDGRSLIATRYVSNTDESPASLYYAEVLGAPLLACCAARGRRDVGC